MPIPLSGRIGIYLTAIGLALILLLAQFWGLNIVFPGVAFLAGTCLIVGIFLLIRTVLAQLDEKKDWATKVLRLADVGPQPRTLYLSEASPTIDQHIFQESHVFPRRPLRRRFAGLPHFGLMATLVWFVAAGPYMVVHFWLNPGSQGIRVSLLPTPPLHAQYSHDWARPLVIQLKHKTQQERTSLYLNSRLVNWQELPDALRDELKLRPLWFVYVQADDDVLWSDVVDAMDMIREAHAGVGLLTTRPSLPQQSTAGP